MKEISKGKILVHDSSNGFLRFLKNHYSDNFLVEVRKKKSGYITNQLKDYSFGFINIGEYDDLMYVKLIELNVRFVFVVSTRKEFDTIKFDSTKVCFLDSFKLKSDIIKQIDLSIKLMHLNIKS